MCTAVYRVDVICKRVHLLVVTIVVLNRHLDGQRVGFLLEIDRLVVKRGSIFIEMLHELRDPAFVVELM